MFSKNGRLRRRRHDFIVNVRKKFRERRAKQRIVFAKRVHRCLNRILGLYLLTSLTVPSAMAMVQLTVTH